MSALRVRLRMKLDRFDLEVDFGAAGGVTGLFGPSGAGKSSLLGAIAGVRQVADGVISFQGESWLDSARGVRRPPEARGVGYVPQESLLFPHRDVEGNLLAGKRRAIARGGDPRARLAEVVESLELEPLLGTPVAALSGGERRRVAIGRALCSAPRLLLLDEPLASLDQPLRRRLLPMLRRVCTELTVPMLLVSHEPLEVQALCDELIALDRGRVLAHGRPAEVLTDPHVFPLAERAGLSNVLTGRVIAAEREIGTVAIGENELVATPLKAPVGEAVLVELPANQILVAIERPRGLSARNIWTAVVTGIETRGSLAVVSAQPRGGGEPVLVELTEATPSELDLALGREIHLVFKATSCRVIGAADGASSGSPAD